MDTGYRAVLDSFPSDTPSSRILLELIARIADTLTETIGYSSIKTVYQLMLAQDVDMGAVKEYVRDLYQIFADILERGLKHREFSSPLPIQELARHFVMAIRGLSYEWCIRYPDFNLKAQALAHFKLLLDRIKAS